jgi:hypothetical protein
MTYQLSHIVRIRLKNNKTKQHGKRTEAANMNFPAQFAGCTVYDHKTNQKEKTN